MIPAVSAGLHCGYSAYGAAAQLAWGVIPAVSAGLHCGGMIRISRFTDPDV